MHRIAVVPRHRHRPRGPLTATRSVLDAVTAAHSAITLHCTDPQLELKRYRRTGPICPTMAWTSSTSVLYECVNPTWPHCGRAFSPLLGLVGAKTLRELVAEGQRERVGVPPRGVRC